MAEIPPIPDHEPDDPDLELKKIKYQGLVDDWKDRERDPVTEEVRVATLADTREDTVLEVENAREDKLLEVTNARTDKALEVLNARQDTDRAAEAALLTGIQTAYIDVATSSLDRALKRADYLATGFTAITGVYTTLLGIIYAAADTPAQQLPARALIPVAFFGLAITFASIYVAFLRRNVKKRNLLPSGVGGTIADERLKTFLDWVFSGVLDRAWALRTSIIAFGLGVALLPLPFVEIGADSVREITIVCGVALAIWIGGELAYRQQTKGDPYVPDPPTASLGEVPAPPSD
jgi:hypothetical protein